LCAVSCFAGLAAAAVAQTATTQPTNVVVTQAEPVRSAVPQRDTIARMMKRVSVDFQEKRLEDVMNFIRDFTGAAIEPLWVDDRNPDGLDKEQLVSVKVDNVTALALVERILDQTTGDLGGSSTWQMAETGEMQLGPKSRLNKFRRVEIYDINDLITEIPNYTEVPRIDLQQALQASQQGGGGGQSPFREENQDQQQRIQDRQTRATEIMDLLRNLVEMDQWVENGGEGGSMRYWQGGVIVNAPDYMHRGINGYPYWPAQNTVARNEKGRRYVSLTGDTGVAKVTGFGQQPVTAVVGGRPISSGPGGGGR
jgi:hypothetical protein